MMELRILCTNDLHGHLTGPLAAKLSCLKAEEPNAVLLDAGDALKVGNIGVPLFPESTWRYMADAGYDAMTLGNREFHITEAGLRAKLKGAPMPLLCANMHHKGSGEPALAPYSVLHLPCGIAIGVLGILIPMVTARMKARFISAYLFDTPEAAAARYVPALREKCDLLVALTHIGLRGDRELAAAVPGINLILGGHSHNALSEAEIVGNTAIVQSGSHGRYVGDVHAVRGTGGWEFSYRLLPLK